MATNWQQKALEATEQGYIPGNNWQAMLKRHLMRCFPDLVQELGDDLEAYLQATTFEAMLFCEKLEDQGTPNSMAEELTLERLLVKPPDEQEHPTQTEMEEGASNQEQAAMQVLMNSPSGQKLPRKIPLT